MKRAGREIRRLSGWLSLNWWRQLLLTRKWVIDTTARKVIRAVICRSFFIRIFRTTSRCISITFLYLLYSYFRRHMLMQKHKKSFTLIEMLIVIVIIGILSAALIPRLQDVQGRARDTKRKADMQTINTAIQIFLSDNGRPPIHRAANTCWWDTSPRADSETNCTWIWLTAETSFYTILPTTPRDPKNVWLPGYQGARVDGSYVYNYLNSNTFNAALDVKEYDLITQLENRKDPARCEISKPIWHHTAAHTVRCPTYSNYLYSPQ